jgi:lipooligosaccharide transport system ATP-binding protein
MIYGFSPITAGQIEVFGLPLNEEWRGIKSRIGVCQQENTLDPDLTVEENLRVFARYFNIPKREAAKRTEELLAFIALLHRRDEAVNRLSGGLMRRLVLARALINRPELLILDEPTTGLDPQSTHQIWEKLEKLKGKGLSIMLTTHNMYEASHLCDRLIIMDKGAILVEGRPDDLIKKYVGQNVLEVANPGSELQQYVEGQDLTYENLGHRLLIYGEEGSEMFQQISTDYCQEACSLRMATLEDVFLKLTGRDLRE